MKGPDFPVVIGSFPARKLIDLHGQDSVADFETSLKSHDRQLNASRRKFTFLIGFGCRNSRSTSQKSSYANAGKTHAN